MFRIITITLALVGLLLTTACGNQQQQSTQQQKQETKQVQPLPTPASAERNDKYKGKPPAMTINTAKQYLAKVNTSKGSFTIELFTKDSPKTVNNFVFLSRDKFYDGVRFHRIIQDFMIQTGDPLGKGNGGPGYEFADELPPKQPYGPGIVAMANRGPNTNGSQFFICTGPSSQSLSPDYTQFGKVVEGMEAVQAIAATPVASNGREKSSPTEDVTIQSIEIIEK